MRVPWGILLGCVAAWQPDLAACHLERLELHPGALAEQGPLIAWIEPRNAGAVSGCLAIVFKVAEQREQSAADLDAIDFHDGARLAGRCSDPFALSDDRAIDQPSDSVAGAVIADRVMVPFALLRRRVDRDQFRKRRVRIVFAHAERQPLVKRNDPAAADEEVENHPGLQIDGVERAATEANV